ncbi:MAG: abortive infection family protein [Candidatus Glassbacteria bacterium]|nr:abortive infection family protein [Candidatus Glassbacteria bacterium]
MTDGTPDFVLEGVRRILEDWPDSGHLRELIETTEAAIHEGSDKALDGAKCIVECVCKTILSEHGQACPSDASPAKLVTLAARTVGLDVETVDTALRDIASGLITATRGLSELRNSNGPLGHGRDVVHQSVGHRHRTLAAATAEAIAVILYEAHAARPLNLGHTRREYNEEADENERMDTAVSVSVDEDNNHIVINDFLTFRPSQVLYALDRGAYVDVLSDLPEEEPEGEEEVAA